MKPADHGPPLRTERQAAGLSQADLAAATGVSRQTIGAIEAGRHSPSVDAAIAIAQTLGKTVEHLFAAPADADVDLAARLRGLKVFAGELPTFDTRRAPADPVTLFCDWMTTAISVGVREPHAMSLATADDHGRPNARVLILKDVAPDGDWLFAGSSVTAKGAELSAQPAAAATFYWPQLGRQIRLRGAVRPADPSESARDFLARSPGARAMTLTARQGQPLLPPDQQRRELADAHARLEADPTLVAAGWTVWTITANEVEFFQGRPDRQHRRLKYARTTGGWTQSPLSP